MVIKIIFQPASSAFDLGASAELGGLTVQGEELRQMILP